MKGIIFADETRPTSQVKSSQSIHRTYPAIHYLQVLFAAITILVGNTANATTYTVTNHNDSGAGSLRQAILNANANPGADNINFAITGAPDFVNGGQNGYTIPTLPPMPPSPAGFSLYGITRNSPTLYKMDFHGNVTSIVSVSIAGYSIGKAQGLATDPTTGDMYGIIELASLLNPLSQHLVKINPSTGVATDVGVTAFRVADITFDADGNLYAVTAANQPNNPATLFSLDKANANFATLILAFPNRSVGDAIAVNYSDGYLYHISGFGSGRTFEKCTLPGCTSLTPITLASQQAEETAMTSVGTGGFIEAANDGTNSATNLLLLTLSGSELITQSSTPFFGGLAIYPAFLGNYNYPPPAEPLPPIIDTVHINGYTQPGSAVATASSNAIILIELTGVSMIGGAGANGLTLASGSSGSSIRGLSINRFKQIGESGHAIFVPAGSNSGSNWIAGNYLNMAPNGTTVFTGSPSFGDGYNDRGTGNNIIGHDPAGPNSANPAADRNVISGAGAGRSEVNILAPSANNKIRGNYIGTDAGGTLDSGNASSGIELRTGNNLIEDNLISGNNSTGLRAFNAQNTIIRRNYIGTDVTGTVALGNFFNGIVTSSGCNNSQITNNVVAFNGGVGVQINTGTGHSILSNSIFSNAGLGINLGTDGITFNDPLDADTGANNLQNSPVLNVSGACKKDDTCSVINPALMKVGGSLHSQPNTDYLVQVFSDDGAGVCFAAPGYTPTSTSCPVDFPFLTAEGRYLLAASIMVTTDANGNATFFKKIKDVKPVGTFMTATATKMLGGLPVETSEFSEAVNVRVGSDTAYEHADGAAGGDGNNGNPN